MRSCSLCQTLVELDLFAIWPLDIKVEHAFVPERHENAEAEAWRRDDQAGRYFHFIGGDPALLGYG